MCRFGVTDAVRNLCFFVVVGRFLPFSERKENALCFGSFQISKSALLLAHRGDLNYIGFIHM